jgi:nitrogen PTS system EIIA component
LHLLDFLSPSRVAVQQPLVGTDAVLARLVALALPASSAREETLAEVTAREAVFPTALGDGVAMPHVRSSHVETLTLSAVVLTHAIPFGSRDGNDVDVFLLVLSPSNAPSQHLNMLRAVARLVAQPATIQALRHATSVAAFLAVVGKSPSF